MKEVKSEQWLRSEQRPEEKVANVEVFTSLIRCFVLGELHENQHVRESLKKTL